MCLLKIKSSVISNSPPNYFVQAAPIKSVLPMTKKISSGQSFLFSDTSLSNSDSIIYILSQFYSNYLRIGAVYIENASKRIINRDFITIYIVIYLFYFFKILILIFFKKKFFFFINYKIKILIKINYHFLALFSFNFV